MTTDLLRTEANERVDKTDFDFLADGAVQAEHRQVMGEMFTDPTRLRAWILDGFAIDCPSGKNVRVTKGRAILSQRVAGEIKYGVLTTEGDTTKTVDINAFGVGTYYVYVRFELVSGDLQSRIFWNPTGNGFEYANTIATRYQANWSMRVEGSSPGAEWLLIGEVDQATLAHSGAALPAQNLPDEGIIDQRVFYYEGSINRKEVTKNFTWNNTTTVAATGADTSELSVGDFFGLKADGQLFEITAITPNVDVTIDNTSGLTIPAGAGAGNSFMDDSLPAPYASGWSADGGTGGSTADDRKNDRSAYGVADAQMFNAAIRQCIEDIKGRGLRRWWERDIGGMNLGFDAAPVEGVLAIGDANFNLAYGSGNPAITFDSGTDELSYNRANNRLSLKLVNIEEVRFGVTGIGILNGLNVGIAVATAPVDAQVHVKDVNFGLFGSATIPLVKFDANDEFKYTRATNQYEFIIGGGAAKFLVTSTVAHHIGGFRCGAAASAPAAGDGIFPNGLVVGLDAIPTNDAITIFDANFKITGSAVPTVTFDTGDSFSYNRAGNQFRFLIGSSPVLEIDTAADFTVPIEFHQADLGQRLIDTQDFPLNGITLLVKNEDGGAITQGEIVACKDQALVQISVILANGVASDPIGTVYDATIANGAWGYVTVWGPGYVLMNYNAGVAGERIGPGAVNPGEGAQATDHYVAWLPYTQAGAGIRVVEAFIVGAHHTT